MPAIPATLSSAGHDFIRLCLIRDVDARPTATQLLQHPFIEEQFETVATKTSTVKKIPSEISSSDQSAINETVRMNQSQSDGNNDEDNENLTVPIVAGGSSTVNVGGSFVASSDSSSIVEIEANRRFKQALTFPL